MLGQAGYYNQTATDGKKIQLGRHFKAIAAPIAPARGVQKSTPGQGARMLFRRYFAGGAFVSGRNESLLANFLVSGVIASLFAVPTPVSVN
jgi:hypothetical protein